MAVRSPDAAQRAALAAWCAADPGSMHAPKVGPGSAEQRKSAAPRPGHETSLGLLAERRAEGVAGIDPDNAEFTREEFQLLQRERETLVLGMAVDVGIELRGEEIAVDHVALELRHVDAVGGEAAHRLVKRGGQIAHPENKGGDQRPRALLSPIGFAR